MPVTVPAGRLAERRCAIVTGDFVKTGGMDRANHALASYLARHDWNVDLVAFRADGDLLAHPNVVLHRVPKPAASYTLALPLLARYGRRYARRVAASGGRVVANGGSCQWGDVNWVHYVHAAYEPEFRVGLPRRVVGRWSHAHHRRDERRALRAARVTVVNSERTKRDVVELLGIDADRVRTVYYGVDSAAFRPAQPGERDAIRAELGWAQDRPIFAFIGAMSDRRKGFDVVYDAWAQLCRGADWDADLVVIGAGDEVPRWRSRSAADGLADRVRFLGHRADVPKLLRACDAFLAPTRYEAYGLAVHEALCCGLPAFVSSNAGVAERYPVELRHLLINPEDAVDLAQRLRTWECDAGRIRPALGRFAAQLRAYTWDHMAADFVSAVTGT